MERTLADSGSAGATPVRIGVLGTGALGQHHVRNLADLSAAPLSGETMPAACLVGHHDPHAETAERVAAEHGSRAFARVEELTEQVDAVVVAAPTIEHAALAIPLLRRGVHVLVEKPMAATLDEADRMLDAAAAGGAQLGVGHIEFYNPAVQAVLDRGARPGYVEVQRLGTFTRRSLDVDVVLDLMIHDLQILHALDAAPVAEVRATGIEVLSQRIDIANVRIELESGCVANLTASRVSSEKVRRLRLFGQQSYFSVDYQSQEVKSYRLDASGGEPRIVDDSPQVERCEPLRAELTAFLRVCRGQPTRWVDGPVGRQALATALDVVTAIKS